MSPQINVARATSQKRIDANRRNAQKSTGPRTAGGKSRSRFNGLKHGLTASVPVIPGEDPAVYEARLEAMTESLPPRNQVELDLLGRVAATTWSLERAARAEAALLNQRIRNDTTLRERREEEEAVALGQRLLWDARGPWQAYPHHPQTGLSTDTLTSRPQDPADANTPALQVLRLERTVAGCRWLLDRWAELRARLEPGEVWTAPDQFKAIRLLGKQPLDAIDDPDVTLICLASVKLLPGGQDVEAFAAITNELPISKLRVGKDEHSIYENELRRRPLAQLRPADEDAAREALRALVDRRTARLELILARNQEVAEADAAEAPDRLAFDPSPEGEKLRRYALSAARLANQTIRTFLSVVRCPLSVQESAVADGSGLNNVRCPLIVEESPDARPAWSGQEAQIDSHHSLRTEPNTLPGPSLAPASFDAEASWATAPQQTEPNTLPRPSPPPASLTRRRRRRSGSKPNRRGRRPSRGRPHRLNRSRRRRHGAKPNPTRCPLRRPSLSFDPESFRHGGPASERTEANAVAGRWGLPHSLDPHPPPASASAPAPTVAAGSGPYDVRMSSSRSA